MSQSLIDNQSYEDRRVDQGVGNYYQMGHQVEVSSGNTNTSGSPRKKRFSHSHRGWRASPLPSDSELDENNKISEPVDHSPHDRVGLQLTREALRFAQLPEVKQLPEDTRQVAIDAMVSNRHRQLLEEADSGSPDN